MSRRVYWLELLKKNRCFLLIHGTTKPTMKIINKIPGWNNSTSVYFVVSKKVTTKPTKKIINKDLVWNNSTSVYIVVSKKVTTKHTKKIINKDPVWSNSTFVVFVVSKKETTKTTKKIIYKDPVCSNSTTVVSKKVTTQSTILYHMFKSIPALQTSCMDGDNYPTSFKVIPADQII